MTNTRDLTEIKARAEAARAMADKATAEPWSWSQYPSGSTSVTMGRGPDDDGVFLYLTRRSDGSEPQKADDAAFIAAARSDVPALAADVLSLCALYEASQDALTDALAELTTARALLAELLDETGLKASYTARDGTLHPGATSTVKDVWRFLWGEGKAE